MYVKSNEKTSILLIGLLIFSSIFMISHLVYSLGFRSLVVIPLSMVILFSVLILHNRKLQTWVVLIILTSLVTSSLSGVYWGSWKAALFPSLIGLSLLIASVANRTELNKLVAFGSTVLLVILLGAWVAFTLGVSGIPSAGTFYSSGGRAIEFYYTSLAIPYPGNFLRATGIYDEPGTLSFIVCVFAFLRHVMNLDKRLTWILLLLGFVTFSLAHLVYVIIHLFSERNILKTLKNLLIFGCAFVLLLSAMGSWHFFEERLLKRLETSSNPNRVLVGDNRSQYLFSTIKLIEDKFDITIFSFGADISCIEGTSECGQYAPGVGFNPLSPLVHYGFLISWPYYLFIFFSIGFGLMRRDFWPLFAVGLLFMQRPSVLSAGYSMLAALVIVVVLRSPAFKKLYSRLFNTDHLSSHVSILSFRDSA